MPEIMKLEENLRRYNSPTMTTLTPEDNTMPVHCGAPSLNRMPSAPVLFARSEPAKSTR